jgi:hypothetical protein
MNICRNIRRRGLFSAGIAIAVSTLLSCSRNMVDNNADATVSIPLSSSYASPLAVRVGDSSSIVSIFPRRNGASLKVSMPLQKMAASAGIKEARVMVLNEFNAQSRLASAGKADFYCAMSESNYSAFSGRNLVQWAELLTGMSHYISLDLVYTGTLKRNGGFVEGDIMVRTGTNLVLVCYVDNSDAVFWASGAEYVHNAAAVKALVPQSKIPIVDGWQADVVWDSVTQTYDTTVWEDREYLQTQIQDSTGVFTGYVLPKVGAIGYSQAYADTSCSLYRRSTGGSSAGRVMRKITAARQQGQIASIAVTFSRDFYIDTTEVTQQEYEAVMGVNPSSVVGTSQPVENVSWLDAVRFCIRMSARDSLDNCYDTTSWTCDIGKNGYRLPTEAEWLFAYEAGTRTKYYWGDTMNGAYVWYGLNSSGTTHPVAQKLPNNFGLYDMAGNVWEWCNDWNSGLPTAGAVDWTGSATGAIRVLRGGQYGNYNNGTQDGTLCFSISFRYGEAPTSVAPYNGFRCARTVIP